MYICFTSQNGLEVDSMFWAIDCLAYHVDSGVVRHDYEARGL